MLTSKLIARLAKGLPDIKIGMQLTRVVGGDTGLKKYCSSTPMQPYKDASEFKKLAERKICVPAAQRNKEPILNVLKDHIPALRTAEKKQLFCLEISSGSGQHVIHFAPEFPYVTWQPSEYDSSSLDSISAYIQESGLKNIQPPIFIDVREPAEIWGNGKFQKSSVDIVISINLIHISSLTCTEGLFRGAGKLLRPQGLMFMYGPYAHHGVITPESNVIFDRSLRSQNEEWGLRDIDDVEKTARESNLFLVKIVDMPANNKILIWVKR